MRYNSTIKKITSQIWKWIVWGFFSLQYNSYSLGQHLGIFGFSTRTGSG